MLLVRRGSEELGTRSLDSTCNSERGGGFGRADEIDLFERTACMSNLLGGVDQSPQTRPSGRLALDDPLPQRRWARLKANDQAIGSSHRREDPSEVLARRRGGPDQDQLAAGRLVHAAQALQMPKRLPVTDGRVSPGDSFCLDHRMSNGAVREQVVEGREDARLSGPGRTDDDDCEHPHSLPGGPPR